MLDERANLVGKTAAIIGGGGGIGAAITLALAEAGVDVVFCDIDDASLETTRQQAVTLGRRVVSMVADATVTTELAAFYEAAAEAFKRLDIVVNVVGGVHRRNFMDGAAEENARDIQRNYGYVIESVGHAVRLMRPGGGGGSIVNFTTIEAHRGAATFSVYAGAKAATTNFSRAMAVELAAERIRVNCIAPDTTSSNGNWTAMRAEDRAAFTALPEGMAQKALLIYVPMKEQPPVSALANAVLFLASDLAAFITGITLHVDGGTYASSGFLDWPGGDGYVPAPLGNSTKRLFSGTE